MSSRPSTTSITGVDGVHTRAEAPLHGVYEAEGREAALDAARAFAEQFADYPKATAKLTDDPESDPSSMRLIVPRSAGKTSKRCAMRVTTGHSYQDTLSAAARSSAPGVRRPCGGSELEAPAGRAVASLGLDSRGGDP